MNSFIAMILGIVLSASSNVSTHLFQTDGFMAADHQLVQQLPNLKLGKETVVFAEADGKGGDLSCYLLVKFKDAYVVVDSDEEPHNKMCYLTYKPNKNMQARMWLRNNGTATIHFNTTVD